MTSEQGVPGPAGMTQLPRSLHTSPATQLSSSVHAPPAATYGPQVPHVFPLGRTQLPVMHWLSSTQPWPLAFVPVNWQAAGKLRAIMSSQVTFFAASTQAMNAAPVRLLPAGAVDGQSSDSRVMQVCRSP